MFSRTLWTLFAAGAATFGWTGTLDRVGRWAPDPAIAEIVARAARAHDLLMRGDIAGYRDAIQLTDDFLLMDPFGGRPTGVPASDAQWDRIGSFFRDGRDAAFEPIITYRSDDLIVLVARERAHVAIGGLPAQDWSLRVTLVFRRERDGWRLAHRHADPLVRGVSLKQAARITLGETAAPAS